MSLQKQFHVNFQVADIQTLQADWLLSKNVTLNILRLDKLHSVVSGNKWFKLKHYLAEAVEQKQTVATFGGAWSNHIVAVAYCCQQVGLQSIGIIRGEKPAVLSDTLTQAVEYGMELQFVTREEYNSRKKEVAGKQETGNREWETGNEIYWINEGGYGSLGAKGAADIGTKYDLSSYTHIIAGVGTGTMLAGLIMSAKPGQAVIGISAMKGNHELEQQVSDLLPKNGNHPPFTILHDYHFGGFGKHPKSLLSFMNEVYEQYSLPLDIVYTGKVFYAIKDLVEKNYFEPGSKLMMIHSGGLQGNAGVKDGKNLAF